MANFKVGDKVRIIGSSDPASRYIDKTATIWKIEPGGWSPSARVTGVWLDEYAPIDPAAWDRLKKS